MSVSPLRKVSRFLACIAAVALMLPQGTVPSVAAQEPSMTFAETGKTVKGKFLQFFAHNGGTLAQGLPISEEMQERSDTDGKLFNMSYSECSGSALKQMKRENNLFFTYQNERRRRSF